MENDSTKPLWPDEDEWLDLFREHLCGHPEFAEQVARIWFALLEHLAQGPEGVRDARSILKKALRLTYPFTASCRLAYRHYKLSLSEYVKPMDEPSTLLGRVDQAGAGANSGIAAKAADGVKEGCGCQTLSDRRPTRIHASITLMSLHTRWRPNAYYKVLAREPDRQSVYSRALTAERRPDLIESFTNNPRPVRSDLATRHVDPPRRQKCPVGNRRFDTGGGSVFCLRQRGKVPLCFIRGRHYPAYSLVGSSRPVPFQHSVSGSKNLKLNAEKEKNEIIDPLI